MVGWILPLQIRCHIFSCRQYYGFNEPCVLIYKLLPLHIVLCCTVEVEMLTWGACRVVRDEQGKKWVVEILRLEFQLQLLLEC